MNIKIEKNYLFILLIILVLGFSFIVYSQNEGVSHSASEVKLADGRTVEEAVLSSGGANLPLQEYNNFILVDEKRLRVGGGYNQWGSNLLRNFQDLEVYIPEGTSTVKATFTITGFTYIQNQVRLDVGGVKSESCNFGSYAGGSPPDVDCTGDVINDIEEIISGWVYGVTLYIEGVPSGKQVVRADALAVGGDLIAGTLKDLVLISA